MLRFFHRIFNYATLVAFLFLLQIAWIVFSLYELSNHYAPVASVFMLISLLVSVWIINHGGNPSVKMAWLVLVMVFPMVGWVIYLLTGGKQPTRGIRQRLGRGEPVVAPYIPANREVVDAIARQDERTAGLSGYLASRGFPPYTGTDAEYYPTGESAWEAMRSAMQSAEHFIFLEYFVISEGELWDSLLPILAGKAKAGVDVRVLYDGVGSMMTLPRGIRGKLADMGIRAVAFNHVRPVFSAVVNYRDHRKLLIIDGHTVFTGGVNLADEYINRRHRCGYWKDNAVRLYGAAARSVTLMFLEMWNGLCPTDADAAPYLPEVHMSRRVAGEGFVQPYGDTPLDSEFLAENVYLDRIGCAERYVWLVTPYLVIDHAMTTALTYAAKRGVDVRIITPGIPDKRAVYTVTRSHYDELLAGGVRIFEYTPGFVHSKISVCDDESATVGTVNLDYRSLSLHFEDGVLFYRSPVVGAVRRDIEGILAECREIRKPYRHFGLIGQLGSAVLRLLAPLL